MNLQREITLTENRCYDCGRFYAVESEVGQDCICPHCAGKKVEEYRREAEALRRSNNSIRGAMNRRKHV